MNLVSLNKKKKICIPRKKIDGRQRGVMKKNTHKKCSVYISCLKVFSISFGIIIKKNQKSR